MHCPYCGSSVPDNAQACPKCGAATTVPADQVLDFSVGQVSASAYYDNAQSYDDPYAYPQAGDMPITVPSRTGKRSGGGRRNKPHIALRIPLQLLSLVLCIVLTVSLLATALLLDLNRMLSAGGIKQVVNALFTVSQAKVPGPLTGSLGIDVKLDNTDPTIPSGTDIAGTIPNGGELGDLEIPADVLTSGDTEALVDWMLEVLEESTGSEVDISKEQLQEFVEQSTISEYMAEKAAGYAEDFINGTKNTLITSEELMALVEENEALIASTFQVELTDEMKTELQTALNQTIEDNRINEVIHEEVFTSMQESISEALPVEWEQIQAVLKALTSDAILMAAIGVCVVLMLLLCALNFYNIPGGLTWSAVACILSGALLSVPIVLLQASPELLIDVAQIPAAVVQLILSFISALSVVHYGILILGVVLLVLSIIWRAIRAGIRNASPAF